MRTVGITLAALLLAALAVHAQPPGAPGGPAPADPKLDIHLAGWERTMSGVSSFHAKFELKRTEAVFKKDRLYTGMVLCMKPNLARLRLDNAADKTDYEAYICNGKAIYEYNGLAKTITEFKLNPAAGAAGGDNLMLDFLSGMKAADARRRFQISLFKPEDPNYVFLDIKPILPKDKQEFDHVRFALFGPNVPMKYTPYLPAQVWILKPNGDEELWKFNEQQVNVPGVDAKAFEFQNVPGWTVKQAPVGGPMPPAPGGPRLPGGTGLPAGPGAVKP